MPLTQRHTSTFVGLAALVAAVAAMAGRSAPPDVPHNTGIILLDTVPLFGPRQFTLASNQPATFVERFSADHSPDLRYTLQFVNGTAGGDSRVAQAEVRLNGELLFTPAQITPTVGSLHASVQLVTDNMLEITLKGPPNAQVTLTVFGTADPTFTVFGPRLFERFSGVPTQVRETFSVSNTASAPFGLHLRNGLPDGSQRVSSASVLLNGQAVLGPQEFSQQVGRVSRPVNLRTENTLDVGLASGPGGLVEVRLTATDVTPPVLTITQPTPEMVTNLATLDVSGTVTDETFTRLFVNEIPSEIETDGGFHARVALEGDGPHAIDIAAIDAARLRTDSSRLVIRDTEPPVVALGAPVDGLTTNRLAVAVSGTVTDLTPVTLTVNGISVLTGGAEGFTGTLEARSFATEVTLAMEALNYVTVVATDAAGNSATLVRQVIRDTGPPLIALESPTDGMIASGSSLPVTGLVTDLTAVSASVNGVPLAVDGSTFTGSPVTSALSGSAPLANEGDNELVVTVVDAAGNSSTVTRHVTRDTSPPVIAVTESTDGFTTDLGSVTVRGTVSDLTSVALTVNGAVVAIGAGGAFSTSVALEIGSNLISLSATDAAGHVATKSVGVVRTPVAEEPPGEPEPPGPPEPGGNVDVDLELAAPMLDMSTVTTMDAATAFLYTGESPIQPGVAAGTISRIRAAVIRGRVFDRDSNPVEGVRITIHGHPEFGSTATRDNGTFDMAVNGGGPLVINHAADGYLPVHREVDVPWQGFAIAYDVILTALDPAVTVIDFSEPVQIHRASPVSDDDGSRRATLLFFSGTTAEMRMPNGTRVALPSLNVRATEYTVGPLGPEAMPAALPPSSSYTYAVELSADEALAAGAAEVRFSRPVALYLDNFIGVPVGTVVPFGTYDRQRAQWIPGDNGIVLEILGETGGLADLDVDGSGSPAGPSALAALSITDAERTALAQLHETGQEVWRVTTDHFSPADPNFPPDCDPDADCVGPDRRNEPEPQRNPPDSCRDPNRSIVECQNQLLGERISLVGTSFTLNYRSDRVFAHKATRRLRVPLVPGAVPRGLQRVDLIIDVAGRRIRESLVPEPGLTFTFDWDGRDAYGRRMQGSQLTVVRIGYTYRAVYVSSNVRRSDRAFLNMCFSSCSVTPSRIATTFWTTFHTSLGWWDARAVGLGAWTLSAHHTYDPLARVLHLGDGTRRSAESLNHTIRTVAGSGADICCNPHPAGNIILRNPRDGSPATEAPVGAEWVDVGPDGSLYVSGACMLRRVHPGGLISSVVNPGTCSVFNPITDARLAPDGWLYWASACDVFRTHPDTAEIRRAAGAGQQFVGFGEFVCLGVADEGTPALQAIVSPRGIAIGPDGAVYFSDQASPAGASLPKVRKVSADGRVSTVVGSGIRGCLANRPAREARLTNPNALDFGPNGELYVADDGCGRVWVLGTDGILRSFAGGGTGGDGSLATAASLTDIRSVRVGPDGAVYISERTAHRIRRVGLDGIITTVAGGGNAGFGGDGGAAVVAVLDRPQGFGFGPDAAMFIADLNNHRVRRVEPPFRGFDNREFLVPAADGSEVYHFDRSGRHLRTLNAFTGATLLSFSYDAAGRLASIADADDNVTTLERDGDGQPTALVAPFGQRTELALGAEGFLSTVTNPAGESVQLSYAPDGLLAAFTDPRGNTSQFAYDDLGRLVRDTDAAGGFVTLAREDSTFRQRQERGFQVTKVNALDDTTTFAVRQINSLATLGGRTRFVPDAVQWINTFPTTAQATALFKDGDFRTTLLPDGTLDTSTSAADPRWGLQAPFADSRVIRTPGGLRSVMTTARSAVVANRNDPFSLRRQTETVSINGRPFMRTFDAESLKVSVVSPEGRPSVGQVDRNGRIVELQLDPALAPISFSYDDRGQLASTRQGGQVTSLVYDMLGRVTASVDALGDTVRFGYDQADRVDSLTLSSGRGYRFAHDANGNLTRVTMPSGVSHAMSYTAVNLLSAYELPGNPAYAFEYTQDRRWARTITPSGREVRASHDEEGRLSEIEYPEARVTLTYTDATSRVTSLTRTPVDGASAQRIEYSYDGNLINRLAYTGAASGTYTYRYNSRRELVGRQLDDHPEVTFAYNNDGLMIEMGPFALTRTGPGGALAEVSDGTLRVTYTYDAHGRVSERRHTVDGTSVYELQLLYDDLGRVTRKAESLMGDSHVVSYSYDADGQLVAVQHDGVTTERYGYDANGNRTLRQTGGVTESATYDVVDRILSQGATAYTHNEDGFVVNRGSASMRYSAVGELTGVVIGDGRERDYAYDGKYRMVAKRSDSTSLVLLYGDLDRPELVTSSRANDITIEYLYDESRALLAFRREGEWFYVATDHLGSPRIIVDSTRREMSRFEYDAFGNVASVGGGIDIMVGFAGGFADRETGLVRFGLRDYDPIAGRWMSRDPILFSGGQANLFTYVENDPVNRVDHRGTFLLYGPFWRIPGVTMPFPGYNYCGPGGNVNPSTGRPLQPTSDADNACAAHDWAYEKCSLSSVDVSIWVPGQGDRPGCQDDADDLLCSQLRQLGTSSAVSGGAQYLFCDPPPPPPTSCYLKYGAWR